jgi:PhnB protein
MAVQKARSKAKAKPAKKARKAAPKKVKAIPDKYPPLSPVLVLEKAGEAIDWYKKVLGAKERMRMSMPDGKVAHAELTFGPSVLMVADASPMFPASPGAQLALYVKDVDATYKLATDSGATSKEGPKDQFYGDRSARIVDPFGVQWGIMTHVEDVSMKEMQKRMAAMGPPPGAEGGGQGGPPA